jgi:hypothetical protein
VPSSGNGWGMEWSKTGRSSSPVDAPRGRSMPQVESRIPRNNAESNERQCRARTRRWWSARRRAKPATLAGTAGARGGNGLVAADAAFPMFAPRHCEKRSVPRRDSNSRPSVPAIRRGGSHRPRSGPLGGAKCAVSGGVARRSHGRDRSRVAKLRARSRGERSLAEIADGQWPRRCAYQIVPAPHASVPSKRKAAQYV